MIPFLLKFIALLSQIQVYHTRQKNTPQDAGIDRQTFCYCQPQKNPQTEWSGDVVEHCPQQPNLKLLQQ